jgi:drug/metabolite transporter (DMT)-like permease
MISLLLAGAGALWVVFRADVDALLRLQFGRGEQLYFFGCAMHALYAPMGRLLNRGEPLPVFTFGCICGGLLVTVIYGADAIVKTDWLALPAIAWVAVLYLGVVTTAGTVYLVQYATLRLTSAKLMAYGYLVPVFVILWEGLLGHGWVALKVVPGVIAILLALVVLRYQK